MKNLKNVKFVDRFSFAGIAFVLLQLMGCGGNRGLQSVRVNASNQNPTVYASLQPGSSTTLADGSFQMQFVLQAAGAPRFRFTPTKGAPIEFVDKTQYSKNFPASQSSITETGLLEALNASGGLITTLQLQAGPFLPNPGTNPNPNTSLCSTIAVRPSVIVLPLNAAGLAIGEGIGELQILTTKAATLQQITESQMTTPIGFELGSTGAQEHYALVRYRAAGNSKLTLQFSTATGPASCTFNTTVIAAVAAPPQCAVIASSPRVLANNGVGPVDVRLIIPNTSGPVYEAAINSIKLLPGQPVLRLDLPVGIITVQGAVNGPGGVATCTVTVEVYQVAPTCKLVASETQVLPWTKVKLTLVHDNAASSVPVSRASIDGQTIGLGDSIYVYPFFTTRYTGKVMSSLGSSTCQVLINTGL